MKLEDLWAYYDKLQKKYGEPTLHAIYNGGCSKNPDICFVFMNPTGKNVAAKNTWKGIRAPWLGTKNIWDLFYSVELLDENIYKEIKKKKGVDWTPEFCEKVYKNVTVHKYFITNLGKCTQLDARPLPNIVYRDYLYFLKKEIVIINPKVVILLGNQVSSIVLEEKISVSQCRRKKFKRIINEKEYSFYSVF